jgi:predicted amidohydrolase YtcJ
MFNAKYIKCALCLFFSVYADSIVVYPAKKIITMNPAQPEANAVAVKDGKILDVGMFSQIVSELTDYVVDQRFEKDIIVPGFIEAHMHPQIAGFLWQYIYVGYYDRYDPDGNLIVGCKTKKQVLERIAKAVEQKKDKNGWIIAWGYQSEFYGHDPLVVDELDPISRHYKVMVENANMHALYVNSAVFKDIGIDTDTSIPGVSVVEGKFTGELLELKAMNLALACLPGITFKDMCNITRSASRLAHRVGVTTMVDAALGFSFLTHGLQAYQHEVPKSDFPQRVVMFPVNVWVNHVGIDFIQELYKKNNDKLSFDAVKFFTDGSLHCHTAHLQWPFYHHCGCNGMENLSTEELKKQWLKFHEAGLRVAVHVNGSQAIEQALQAAKYILDIYPRFDHRHSFEHTQMATENQLERMATLGVVSNFFINHMYYWGDTHIKNLGLTRAQNLNPLQSALRHGVRFSVHSDASVTPVDPLFSMWAATNRISASGNVLGKHQCISAYEALKAVTLDAAYLLHKDNVLGSIEIGKYADFTILDQNPLEVDKKKIKDIKVKATILGGRIFSVYVPGSWRYLKLNSACRKILQQCRLSL